MVNIIKDRESLIAIKPEWDSLYNESKSITAFQSFGFVESCLDFVDLENSGNTLYIITIFDSQLKSIVAIFPCILSPKGDLEFINQRHCDFCMPLIKPTKDHYNLYKELAEHIKDNSKIKGINFQNIPSGLPILSALKYHYKYIIVRDINFYPIVPIIPDETNKHFTDSFITVPSKKRWNLKKSFSQAKENITFRIISSSRDNEYPERVITDLVEAMVHNGSRTSEYFSERMFSWWKKLYYNGVLSFAVVSEGDVPKSCTLVFYNEIKNECVTWIMLYEDSKWNMRSNLLISEFIYNKGKGVLNLARGIYDYKVSNFHPDVKPLFSLKIAKSKWGHFKNIISTAFHYSKPIIKSWLGR
ncbi:MAG: hypothetical protein NC207_07350 [Bacteroides sp.]|nr:hypothetical protein [Bacteroides sp.]